MAKKSVRDILGEAMPEMEVIESPAGTTDAPVVTDAPSQATRPGPSMAELRKKYLGSDSAPPAMAPAVADAIADDGDDVEVVQVRPKATSADPAAPASPKTVIVSKTKGIIGRQG